MRLERYESKNPLRKYHSCYSLGSNTQIIFGTLYENTFNIEKDVNSLFTKYIAPVINSILETHKLPKQNSTQYSIYSIPGFNLTNDILCSVISSSVLQDKECIEANAVNPVTILFGEFKNGSKYFPKQKLIRIALPLRFIEKSILPNIHNILEKFPIEDRTKFWHEIQPEKIKASIAHELNHWIDDSLHNMFLTNLVSSENEELLKLKQADVDLTYFEINSQIAGIKHLKSLIDAAHENWNSLDFYDLLYRYTPLYQIALFLDDKVNDGTYPKNTLQIWIKRLRRRMSREDLLGASMTHTFNPEELHNPKFKIRLGPPRRQPIEED